MIEADGGFFSATDADSEGEEGRFFVWTRAQVRQALDADEAALVEAYYNITQEGSFEDGGPGASVLAVAMSLEDAAASAGVAPHAAAATLARAHGKLYEARALRPAPALDDKVLASWNGLMIDAFARAAWALDQPDALARAEAAARFVRDNLWGGGRLRRMWRAGEVKGFGFLDDYAFLIGGLLSLFEASADPQWLRWAVALQQVLDAHFWDEASGGYFATSAAHEALLVRAKPDYDGAEPSGNAVAALNLLRLAHLTNDHAYHARAVALLKGLGGALQSAPTGRARLLAALDMALGPSREVFLVLPDPPDPEAEAAMSRALRARFLPNDVRLIVREAQAIRLTPDVPGLAFKVALGGKPTLYICAFGRCERPLTDPAALNDALSPDVS